MSRDGECCYAPAVLDVDGQCCRERVDECGVCGGASTTPSSTTNCDTGIRVRFSATLHDHSSNSVRDVPMLKAQYVSSLKDAMPGVVPEPYVNAEEAPATTTSSAIVLTTTVIFAYSIDPYVPGLFKAVLEARPDLFYRHLMSDLGRVSIALIDTTYTAPDPAPEHPPWPFRDDEDRGQTSTTNCDSGIRVRFSTTLHYVDHISSNGVGDVPGLKAQYVSFLKNAMRRLGIVSEPYVNADEAASSQAPPSTTTTSSAVVLTTSVIFADPVSPEVFKAVLKASPAWVYKKYLMSGLGMVSIAVIAVECIS